MKKRKIKLSKIKLNSIINNFHISNHSIEKMQYRLPVAIFYKDDGNIDFRKTRDKIKQLLSNNILAYVNTDNSVNIAINKNEYFVFEYDCYYKNWVLKTFKEKSLNGYTIFDKFKMACKGYSR